MSRKKSNLTIATFYLLIYSGHALILEWDCQCANENPNMSLFLQKWAKLSIIRFNPSSLTDSWLGEQISLWCLHFCFQYELGRIEARFTGISRRWVSITLFHLGGLFKLFWHFCFPIWGVVYRYSTLQCPNKTSLLS